MGKEIKKKLVIKTSSTNVIPVYITDSSGPVLNSFHAKQCHLRVG